MFWYENKLCSHYTILFSCGSINLITYTIKPTSFSINVFLNFVPILLLVNSQMIFFFLCNFFLTASFTDTFSQTAFNCGLFIVLINANACFLVLVASTCRFAWCVFIDILMVTVSENPLLHCFYFISCDAINCLL